MQFASLSEISQDPVQQQIRDIKKLEEMKKKRTDLELKVAQEQNEVYNFNTYGNNNIDQDQEQPQNPDISDHDFDHPYFKPAFMTAQGDYSKKGPYYSTQSETIKNNKQNTPEDITLDSLSLLDYDLDSAPHKNKIKRDHNFYITQFMTSILDDISLASSQDSSIYDHIKTCKYCRSEISKRIKGIKPDNKIEPFSFGDNLPSLPTKIAGYEFNEIIIIVVVGIVIIFVLDLLVKIGTRLR